MSRFLHSSRIPAFLGILFALALPATAGAAEKGLSVDMTWGTTNADQDRTAQVLPASGSKWVRLTMEWRKLEPRRKGSYDSSTLADYDRAVSLSRQAGQKVLIDLYSTPAWASANGNTMAPPANNADYADVLRFLATRYRGQVEGWEIWNEPNTARFWSCLLYTSPSPRDRS